MEARGWSHKEAVLMKKRASVLVAFGLLMILSSGCFHLHYSAGNAQRAVAMTDESGPTKSFEVKKPWVHMWLWGLVGKDVPVDQWVAEEVGSKRSVSNLKIDSEMSFLNSVANFLTGGIYSPMSVKIRGEYN